MTELDLGTLRGHVDLDLAGFDRKYGQVDDLLDQLARRQVPDVKIDADITAAERHLDAVDTALRTMDGATVAATIDADSAPAERAIDSVADAGEALARREFDPQIDADITKAERKVGDIGRELEVLRRMDASPEVDADITRAQANLGSAESRLKALQGLRAEMVVTADTSAAEDALSGLGDEGAEAGESAGAGLSDGIKSALMAVPVAGGVVLAGIAIGKSLLDGIQDALSIEVGRDLFSARTGLDEATAGRFARAAGESYANAFGESVDANLDTARHALQQGLIDEDDTQAEIQGVVDKLTGITDVFEYDIPGAARAAGQMLKTGLVADADEAFDLITRASQGVMSDDLMDTLNEYSGQFEMVGLSGVDAMGLIRQALNEGARDTDKVADAVKEMGLRIREGTDPAREALQNLGVDVDDVVAGFQAGGPQAREAMGVVFDALRELHEEGGNTQEVIAALFGGPGEDLGAALFALDLATAQQALGDTEGAAQSLLDTIGDNAATQIQSAQRNIETAADGIKGALASAFSDELSGAAAWVSRNRGPLMEFFLDAANGAFDFAGALVEAAATGTEAFGDFVSETLPPVLDGLASAMMAASQLSGDVGLYNASINMVFDAERARDFGDTTEEAADQMRDSWGGALEDMQGRMNEWAGPEIMAAHTHDALLEMAGRVDEFASYVDEHRGGTVMINGNRVPAEEAIAITEQEINEAGGFVTINGETVPAEDALDVLMRNVGESEEDITVRGDTAEARNAVNERLAWIRNQRENVNVGVNDSAVRNWSPPTWYSYVDVRVRNNAAANVPASWDRAFSTGGYTGDMPVDSVAGVVHGQEMVIDAANTREWRPLLEAIHNDSITPADLRRGAPQLAAAGAASGPQVAGPARVRLDPADIDALAAAILSGARDVSAQALSHATRSALAGAGLNRSW
ncbi:phage tail tape measure protein [Georgenia faecalis]|uniref:phage tail tape measure protein n=1 Tax=Georgenia faecalis TaxID=2483799 RepID=UPI000FDB390F|nr:phage tail tape measure protein [Georgenia faecalis]